MMASGQALAVAAIGLCALLLEGRVAGWLIVGLLELFSLARAFSSIASKDVLGRTIPKTWRGQTTAWAASAAGLVTIGAGIALMAFAGSRDDAGQYAVIVLGAVGAAFSTPPVILALSLLGLAGIWLAFRLPEAEREGDA